MNEEQLCKLVSGALERPCGCQAGGACPEGDDWHTWRRYRVNGELHKRDATCFVGTDVGNQHGTFKVNFASVGERNNAQKLAGELNIPVRPDPDYPLKRLIFTPPAVPGKAARECLVSIIRSGVGAFPPPRRVR